MPWGGQGLENEFAVAVGGGWSHNSRLGSWLPRPRGGQSGTTTKLTMPTYDYACEKCGRTFEHFQSMNDPRLTECIFEGCGGAVKRKLGTGAGIIFKGSGFYETDYRSDAYKSAKEKESKAATGGSSDSGDGAKPAAAKEKSEKPAAGPKPAKSAEPSAGKPAKKAASD